MSKFVVNGDMFGKYAEIPTGFSKEMHIYKIVSVFESNSYCDIPLCTVNTKETLHQQIETVLNVIHCGIDESEVVRVALNDCQIINNQPQVQQWIPCSERLPTMHECQENDCRFIVTDGNRRYQAWFNIYDGFFEIPRNRDDIMREDKCVIAWQPLPSVWKGENNAEK